MTHAIGFGTATKGVNAPQDWWLELGRAACAAGVSIGELLRRLAEAGAEQCDPALARRLAEARRRHYGAALLALFALALVWGTDDLRRPRQHQVRIVRTNRRETI